MVGTELNLLSRKEIRLHRSDVTTQRDPALTPVTRAPLTTEATITFPTHGGPRPTSASHPGDARPASHRGLASRECAL